MAMLRARFAPDPAALPEVIVELVSLSAYEALLAPRAEEMRSEEHTSELQSLMRTSYAVFCYKKKTYFNMDIYYYPYYCHDVNIHYKYLKNLKRAIEHNG